MERASRLLLTFLLLLGGLVMGGGGSGPPPAAAQGLLAALDPLLPLHPTLQIGAGAEPARRARVIVQKISPAISSRLIAMLAGGQLIEEIPFIHALVLELPLGRTPALALLAGVRVVTPDGPIRFDAVKADKLKTTHQAAIDLPPVWNDPDRPLTGAGVTVAVIDSGVDASHPDLQGNVVAVSVNGGDGTDPHGHGTHVIGTIAGRDDQGRYLGVAPGARVISVRIGDAAGDSTEAALLRGLQWVHDHAGAERIRVVNLSLSVGLPTPAVMSPVAAAVERLWRDGVVVVASAGNRGAGTDAAWFPPGNDPFVISVGALDHGATGEPADDRLAEFSSRGRTQQGDAKPDLVAPGRRIVAPLAAGSALGRDYADRITDGQYLRLSGTSMAAPIVSGVTALLLEHSPNLTPDQVKGALRAATRRYTGQADGAGVVDPGASAEMAESGGVTAANRGALPSIGLPLAVATGEWGQFYWDQSYWQQFYWDDGGSRD